VEVVHNEVQLEDLMLIIEEYVGSLRDLGVVGKGEEVSRGFEEEKGVEGGYRLMIGLLWLVGPNC
jgi:hypothetical protein